jgi:hypothetical protein
MNIKALRLFAASAVVLCLLLDARAVTQTFRLVGGVTLYAPNPDGKPLTVTLAVRDLNLYNAGPRELLFKIYDPDGKPVVREIIPDDGITDGAFMDRIGGWDHELQYLCNLYGLGTRPAFRWSAWSSTNRLAALAARSFERTVPGLPGTYRIVLAGTPDHVVTVGVSPDRPVGVAGHPPFLHGHDAGPIVRYAYMPPGADGVFFAVAEPDLPATRRFKLTGPDGTVRFDGMATGAYASVAFQASNDVGKLYKLEVSGGANDYWLNLGFSFPRKDPQWFDYVGMGSQAVWAGDPETARALKGGVTEVDGKVFWHPFQVRFHRWLAAHPLDANEGEKALRAELDLLFRSFHLLETSDGRGGRGWHNWAYSMGYYGSRVYRPGWTLLARADVPAELKAIIREGLIMAGDRLSFATGMEKVNGNAFSQINVALWYCHRATGDAIQKERFELFWNRWANEGWGPGSGLSRSGDSQEHFAHDAHYGSYLMDNWLGREWVTNGILGDAKDDPRFQAIVERYRELYTYLYCREANGVPVAANPWSSRTCNSTHAGTNNWEFPGHAWKGLPGPDFTVSVNGGDEWFAARRKGYYALTFHGRLAPAWMCDAFEGQLGFGGGALCQLTVPGKGPVLAGTLPDSYGKGMHLSNWRAFHIHALVGELWDGRPIVSGVSEHNDAALAGTTVTSSGEVRNSRVRIARAFDFQPDGIACRAALAPSAYENTMSLWSHDPARSAVRLAYEMIPYLDTPRRQPSKVTLKNAAGEDGGDVTAEPKIASSVRIDRGGFGVEIRLDKPRNVQLGQSRTVLIELVGPGTNAVPANQVSVAYTIVPFGG